MDDKQLDALLQTLEEPPASPGFTARVLARVDARSRLGARSRWMLASAAATTCLVLVVALGLWQWREVKVQRLATELNALRAEHQALEQRLQRIEQQRATPVLYLGGDDKVDYVLDLAPRPAALPLPPQRRPAVQGQGETL